MQIHSYWSVFISNDKENISVSELLQTGYIERYPNRGGAEEFGKGRRQTFLLAAVIAHWQGESADTLRLRSQEDMRSR